jgi:nitrate/nitrite transporter NarK
MLKLLPLGNDYKEGINRQYKIFSNKHTWAMTIIYTMTFGSFIGYAATLAEPIFGDTWSSVILFIPIQVARDKGIKRINQT